MLHVALRIFVLRLRDLRQLSALLCRHNSNQLGLCVVASCLDLLVVLDNHPIDVERWCIREEVVGVHVIEW